MDLIASCINRAHAQTSGVTVVLENVAGQVHHRVEWPLSRKFGAFALKISVQQSYSVHEAFIRHLSKTKVVMKPCVGHMLPWNMSTWSSFLVDYQRYMFCS